MVDEILCKKMACQDGIPPCDTPQRWQKAHASVSIPLSRLVSETTSTTPRDPPQRAVHPILA